MNISIIIPAYNAADTITDCLKSVDAQDTRALEVLVVDDCSNDDTAQKASRLGAVVIVCEKRSGPAKARNIGAEAAAGEIILFLDADVTVPSNLLNSITCILGSHHDIAAVQTVYSPECTADDIVSIYQNLYYHCALAHVKDESVAIFATWCVAVRKRDFDAVGGFNTKIPEPTVEDEELGYSLVDSGRSIYLAKDIMVVHLATYTLCQFARRRFRMAKA
ncbi:MAG: glycosyltransferase, partial [Candidatus Aegiribacteria sp.]|nr:glycosyltransferase [Candidatus Aegiribacteria sp.]